MRIPWRRLIWAAVILVPVVAAGIILWLSTRDLSRYQARLTEQVRKATGRELRARVPLSVKFGREPALVAEGVTLTNAPWASRPELARVRRLTMYLEPFSLLLGEAKVGKVLLEGAEIAVERNEAGDANLEMLPPPDGSGPHAGENRSLRIRANPAFPWINTIEVRDSVLTVSEGAGRPPCYVEIKNVHLMRRAGLAEFPDAKTERGAKHLDELGNMVAQGHRAVMLYLIQIGSAERFALARDIDPKYDAAFDRARSRGVEAMAWKCMITMDGIEIAEPVPMVE